MNEREFEEFIMMQMKRSQRIHGFNRWLYLVLAVAAVVMLVVAVILRINVLKALSAIPMALMFLLSSRFSKSAAEGYRYAAEDMEYVLGLPDGEIPEEYTDATKAARRSACRSLASTRGLIISYGIISLSCWGAAGVLLWVTTLEYGMSQLIFFGLTMVLAAMAVILMVLTIHSIRDLPMAKKYRTYLKETAEGHEPEEFAGKPAGTSEGPEVTEAAEAAEEPGKTE